MEDMESLSKRIDHLAMEMKCLMSMSGGGNRRMQSNMENEISYYRSVVNRIDVENSKGGLEIQENIKLLFEKSNESSIAFERQLNDCEKRRVDFEKLMKQNLDNINENIEDIKRNMVDSEKLMEERVLSLEAQPKVSLAETRSTSSSSLEHMRRRSTLNRRSNQAEQNYFTPNLLLVPDENIVRIPDFIHSDKATTLGNMYSSSENKSTVQDRSLSLNRLENKNLDEEDDEDDSHNYDSLVKDVQMSLSSLESRMDCMEVQIRSMATDFRSKTIVASAKRIRRVILNRFFPKFQTSFYKWKEYTTQCAQEAQKAKINGVARIFSIFTRAYLRNEWEFWKKRDRVNSFLKSSKANQLDKFSKIKTALLRWEKASTRAALDRRGNVGQSKCLDSSWNFQLITGFIRRCFNTWKTFTGYHMIEFALQEDIMPVVPIASSIDDSNTSMMSKDAECLLVKDRDVSDSSIKVVDNVDDVALQSNNASMNWDKSQDLLRRSFVTYLSTDLSVLVPAIESMLSSHEKSIRSISHFSSTIGQSLFKFDSDLRRQKDDIGNRVALMNEKLDASLKSLRSSLVLETSAIKDKEMISSASTANKFKRIQNVHDEFDARFQGIEKKFEETKNRLDRLFLVYGDIICRMENLEGHLERNRLQIEDFDRKLVIKDYQDKEISKQLESVLSSEFKLTNQVEGQQTDIMECREMLCAIKSSFEGFEVETKSNVVNINGAIVAVMSNLKAFGSVQVDWTDFIRLYDEFEAMEIQGKQEGKRDHEMTKEYYASLSGITLQLATQIAMETDNETLQFVFNIYINGSNTLLPANQRRITKYHHYLSMMREILLSRRPHVTNEKKRQEFDHYYDIFEKRFRRCVFYALQRCPAVMYHSPSIITKTSLQGYNGVDGPVLVDRCMLCDHVLDETHDAGFSHPLPISMPLSTTTLPRNSSDDIVDSNVHRSSVAKLNLSQSKLNPIEIESIPEAYLHELDDSNMRLSSSTIEKNVFNPEKLSSLFGNLDEYQPSHEFSILNNLAVEGLSPSCNPDDKISQDLAKQVHQGLDTDSLLDRILNAKTRTVEQDNSLVNTLEEKEKPWSSHPTLDPIELNMSDYPLETAAVPLPCDNNDRAEVEAIHDRQSYQYKVYIPSATFTRKLSGPGIFHTSSSGAGNGNGNGSGNGNGGVNSYGGTSPSPVKIRPRSAESHRLAFRHRHAISLQPQLSGSKPSTPSLQQQQHGKPSLVASSQYMLSSSLASQLPQDVSIPSKSESRRLDSHGKEELYNTRRLIGKHNG